MARSSSHQQCLWQPGHYCKQLFLSWWAPLCVFQEYRLLPWGIKEIFPSPDLTHTWMPMAAFSVSQQYHSNCHVRKCLGELAKKQKLGGFSWWILEFPSVNAKACGMASCDWAFILNIWDSRPFETLDLKVGTSPDWVRNIWIHVPQDPIGDGTCPYVSMWWWHSFVLPSWPLQFTPRGWREAHAFQFLPDKCALE